MQENRDKIYFRFYNDCLHSFIMVDRRWVVVLNLDANGFTMIKMNISLTWQLTNAV